MPKIQIFAEIDGRNWKAESHEILKIAGFSSNFAVLWFITLDWDNDYVLFLLPPGFFPH